MWNSMMGFTTAVPLLIVALDVLQFCLLRYFYRTHRPSPAPRCRLPRLTTLLLLLLLLSP
jgi:hypothetical protein